MAKSDTKAVETAIPDDSVPLDATVDEAMPPMSTEAVAQADAEAGAGADSAPLRATVAGAAHAALLAGRYVDYAALHSLELALVDVHHRLVHARPALIDSHAGLLQRIDAIL